MYLQECLKALSNAAEKDLALGISCESYGLHLKTGRASQRIDDRCILGAHPLSPRRWPTAMQITRALTPNCDGGNLRFITCCWLSIQDAYDDGKSVQAAVALALSKAMDITPEE